MRSQWKRLAIAACLSLLCATATLLWYRLTARDSLVRNETPLAQVGRVGDEVLRRPPTRLLWQIVNTGDNLYNGETVRTSARGDMRIQFEDGRYIDLEPDSLIVLQKNKGEISLDLMEGSAFVNAKATEDSTSASPGLVLNSKNGKVDLTGASASLSKGSGDRLDFQVLEGKAKVEGANGQTREVGSGSGSSLSAAGVQFDQSAWKVLSPQAGKALMVDPDAERSALFRWQGVPAQWEISLWTGETRKALRETARAEKPGEISIATALPLGKHWYKLVATDPTTHRVMAETNTARVDIQGRSAPAPSFPTNETEIPSETADADVTLKWSTPEQALGVHVEVATDASMAHPIAAQDFAREEEMNLPGLRHGTYYWRVSSRFEGAEKAMISRVQKFSLVKPAPKNPAEIVWALPEEKSKQLYTGEPSLELAWQSKTRQSEIKNYRIRLESEGNLGEAPLRFETTSLPYQAKIGKPGRYIASVEALDQEGSVIGKSEPRSVAALELPRLPAPVLIAPEGTLQSGFDGRLDLKWNDVDGAKSYRAILANKQGREVASKKAEGPAVSFKNLMPGDYQVKLEAVDSFGRPSLDAAARPLVVPDKSALRAPTLKRIKVN